MRGRWHVCYGSIIIECCSIILYLLLIFLSYLSILQSTASTNVNSSKYTSMDSSTASGGIELKDKPKSFVDPDVSEVKTTLDDDDDDEPTKEAVA